MGKSKGNSENWLMTYGDLVTLLLVFFVLLYTLTPGVEDETFDSFVSYFQNSSGFFQDNNLKTDDSQSPMDPEEIEEEIEARLEYWKSFADFLEEQDYASEVDLQILSNGVKITLSDSLTFESGSSEILEDAETVLSKVAGTIDSRIVKVEVQGHTDNIPISRNSFYQSNWHLGAARAVSVVLFLQANSKVSADNFKASSFGEYVPVASNDTEEGRRANRRVEIYLRDTLMDEDAELAQVWVD